MTHRLEVTWTESYPTLKRGDLGLQLVGVGEERGSLEELSIQGTQHLLGGLDDRRAKRASHRRGRQGARPQTSKAPLTAVMKSKDDKEGY